jgi:hypothetical protein
MSSFKDMIAKYERMSDRADCAESDLVAALQWDAISKAYPEELKKYLEEFDAMLNAAAEILVNRKLKG